MKNITINKCAFVLFIFCIFNSCDEGGDPDPGASVPVEFAGDWFLKTLDSDGSEIVGYQLFSTYNTAANTNEIWVDDNGNVFPFKSKAMVDFSAFTFNASGVSNSADSTITVTITEGKLLKDQAITSGGNIADSLYFKIETSETPGTVYTIAGYKRTGFLEDEH